MIGFLYLISIYLFPISLVCLFLTKSSIFGSILFCSLAIINYVKVPYIIGMLKMKRYDNSIPWRYVFGTTPINMIYGIVCPIVFLLLFCLSIIVMGFTWQHIVAVVFIAVWIYYLIKDND